MITLMTFNRIFYHDYMKTALAILLSTLSITFLSAQDLELGLVLKYDLDGNYQDDSPNEFHGTGDTDFGEDRFGNPTGCALFNGTTNFIDLPNEEEIELQYPLTIAFWFNTESELATDNVMVTTDYALNNHSGVWMNMSSARKISISIGDATGSTSSSDRRTKTGETTIETNTWYHAVGIVRGPNDMDLYLNCENDGGSGHGDFIFDLNCSPSEYTVNWTASDCAGNTAEFTQTYSSTFAGIMAASCYADLNFDQTVNVQDQLKLLSRYGQHSFLGVADMNRDRQLNVDDLMQFLAGYGVMCE